MRNKVVLSGATFLADNFNPLALLPRPPSPSFNTDVREKLRDANTGLFTTELSSRLSDLQQHPSPPKRKTTTHLYVEGFLSCMPDYSEFIASSSASPSPSTDASATSTVSTELSDDPLSAVMQIAVPEPSVVKPSLVAVGNNHARHDRAQV